MSSFPAYKGASIDNARKLLRPSQAGTFGSGYYFADYRCAEVWAHGGVIIEVSINISNPYRITLTPEQSDSDPIGAALLAELYTNQGRDIPLSVFSDDEFKLTSIIQQELESQNFDGIVVTYPGTNVFEAVVYDPASIEITCLNNLFDQQAERILPPVSFFEAEKIIGSFDRLSNFQATSMT